MRWLGRYIARHRRAGIGSILSGIVGGASAAAEPFLVGVIIDHIEQGASPDVLLQDVGLILLFAIITVVAFYGQRTYSGEIAYSVNYDIRRDVFDNMLTLDQAFFQHYPTGDLISRMYADVDMVWKLLALGFNRAGSAITTLIVTFVLLASIHLPLTIAVFIILTITTSLQMRAGLRLAPVFEQVQEQAGALSAHVQDSVSGIQTIKTFGREEGASAKFAEENREYRRRWLFFKRRNEPVGMLPNAIAEATTGIVVLFGGILTVNGSLTVGNFTQFLLYLTMIGTVLLQIGTTYQRFQQTRGALTRLTPLLQEPEIRSEPNARHLVNPRGEIEYDHVSVRDESGGWMLKDVCLKIPSGAVVAFVGPTGCGKTLMVNLLARVLDPDEGRILIDGVDVRDVDLEDLREAIAYVPQSTFLFSQELHSNVRMGSEDLSDQALQRALHISRVSNDLPQLPRGLNTLVGEKGVMLSGGQKQRVAIARAIIREPAILVLDDALSSVDTQTAADILGDLRQVLKSRTSLIIAHRIATVKDADMIVVVENGVIVETGTHTDLIANNGLYAQMVERELSGEEITL